MGLALTAPTLFYWLEHGDPARDEEFYLRPLDVDRAAAKPRGARRGR
jgi:hypothetical protein